MSQHIKKYTAPNDDELNQNVRPGIVEMETKNLLAIIKLRELFRFKQFLVHYRYDFEPKVECTIAELAWGFVRDPWFADAVADNLAQILPDIRDEPPVFVQEWENLGTEDTHASSATMEIFSEYTTIDYAELDLPPPLISDNDSDSDSDSDSYSDMPPLIRDCGGSRDCRNCDSNELEEGEVREIREDMTHPEVKEDTLESLLAELENTQVDSNYEQQNEQQNINIDYSKQIEGLYTEYLLHKFDGENEITDSKKKLNDSIAELYRTADMNSPQTERKTETPVEIDVDRYYVAEEAQMIQDLSPTPSYVVNVPAKRNGDDNVLVRVFTVNELKRYSGPDLADPKFVPESQSFYMPKNATWGESVWEEFGYRTNIVDSWDDWSVFVFSKRGNGTIRPSHLIDEYTPLSVYQKKLDVAGEVWLLLLETPEPKRDEIIVYKKWLYKNWCYFQGFQVTKMTDLLKNVFPKSYISLFEEVCAINNDHRDRIDKLLEIYSDLKKQSQNTHMHNQALKNLITVNSGIINQSDKIHKLKLSIKYHKKI